MTTTLAPADRQKVAGEAARRIREHPETHHQAMWLAESDDAQHDGVAYRSHVSGFAATGTDEICWSECGTTACAAGHVVAAAIGMGLLDPDAVGCMQIGEAAATLLGLSASPDLFDSGMGMDCVLAELNDLAGGAA